MFKVKIESRNKLT